MSKSLVAPNVGALRRYLIAVTGLTKNWGVAGVCGTRRNSGYHLPKSEIYSACGKGDKDYSVQRPRDKRGLSENGAGFDFGSNLGRKRLVQLTTWMEAQAKAGKLDLQEFLGPRADGKGYWWSKSNGWSPKPLTVGSKAERSHRSHVHVSFPRDLTHPDMGLPDLIGMFEPHFGKRPATLPPDDPDEPEVDEEEPPEEDMPFITTPLVGHEAVIGDPASFTTVRDQPAPDATVLRQFPKGQTETWIVVGWVTGEHSAFGNSDQWLARVAPDSGWEYTAKGNVRKVRPSRDEEALSALREDLKSVQTELSALHTGVGAVERSAEQHLELVREVRG